MEKQTANTILMIEPVAFGFNSETAVNNYFQFNKPGNDAETQAKAHAEFMHLVEALREKGIRVITIKDTPEPHTPDSIFPNNWISFHAGGKAVIYPMFAKNRRAECRLDVLEKLISAGLKHYETIDYRAAESQNQFLEGTGSMILDRVNKIAYAALSERTNEALFHQFCTDFAYTPVSFTARQNADEQRLPIYHTNVMMCIADRFAIICLNSIDDIDERKKVIEHIQKTKKELIEISEMQVHHFAGNMLQVENEEGTPYLVMSKSAYHSLSGSQLKSIQSYNEIIVAAIPTIELLGGGSVRCMMAEIF